MRGDCVSRFALEECPLALQPTLAAISFSQQVALAGNEELVQTQAGAVQETATLPRWM